MLAEMTPITRELSTICAAAKVAAMAHRRVFVAINHALEIGTLSPDRASRITRRFVALAIDMAARCQELLDEVTRPDA
jgi:hypothetical protein